MITKHHLNLLGKFIVGAWLACLFIFFFLLGIGLSPLIFPDLSNSPRLNLATVFNSLTAEMRFSYSNLRIEDNPFHFRANELAHCHTDTREICIKPETLENYPETIWHEIAHAYYFVLSASASDFGQRWKSIGGEYLTFYGSAMGKYNEEVGYEEDIAKCVECVYLEACGYDSEFHFRPHRLFQEQNSPYLRKINLLLEFKFFGQEIHSRALDRLK